MRSCVPVSHNIFSTTKPQLFQLTTIINIDLLECTGCLTDSTDTYYSLISRDFSGKQAESVSQLAELMVKTKTKSEDER